MPAICPKTHLLPVLLSGIPVRFLLFFFLFSFLSARLAREKAPFRGHSQSHAICGGELEIFPGAAVPGEKEGVPGQKVGIFCAYCWHTVRISFWSSLLFILNICKTNCYNCDSEVCAYVKRNLKQHRKLHIDTRKG